MGQLVRQGLDRSSVVEPIGDESPCESAIDVVPLAGKSAAARHRETASLDQLHQRVPCPSGPSPVSSVGRIGSGISPSPSVWQAAKDVLDLESAHGPALGAVVGR